MTTTVGGVRELGAAVRRSRLAQGLSQADLAPDARVGRQWLVGFEAGDKASAPLDMVWRLLAELDLSVTLKPPPTPATGGRGQPPPIIQASDIIARHLRGAR
ncbi:MAG: helix-turn-helix transcriptional regulator [Bifidobacteriaceae bacterium]|jgi:transcriptional regulator with XRE-family HTH domain|nr:helix-turn-helix transcriptional regulator [Bifidobacteriaceae bacterium]